MSNYDKLKLLGHSSDFVVDDNYSDVYYEYHFDRTLVYTNDISLIADLIEKGFNVDSIFDKSKNDFVKIEKGQIQVVDKLILLNDGTLCSYMDLDRKHHLKRMLNIDNGINLVSFYLEFDSVCYSCKLQNFNSVVDIEYYDEKKIICKLINLAKTFKENFDIDLKPISN